MTNELEGLLFTERYRPSSFEELILEDKGKILAFLKEPKSIPSFIFSSRSPGTGKTSTAKLICKYLGCDLLTINASAERGVDTVRDQVRSFAQSLSSTEAKRCVFMDEADFVLGIAQASLRNILEEYSDNCFWIFTCNEITKLIEPIRSRCVAISFDNPNKGEIRDRLEYICKQESIEYDIEDLSKLVQKFYPDLRSMILTLQSSRTQGLPLTVDYTVFEAVYATLLAKDAKGLYKLAYTLSPFEVSAFCDWFLKKLYLEYDKYGYDKLAKISRLLADVEKSANLNLKLPIIFLANMLSVASLL